MFEDLAEFAIGPWGLAAAAACAVSCTDRGRSFAKTATRYIVRAWYSASEKSAEMFADIKEQTDDLIAEVKSERAANQNGTKHSNPKSKQEKT